MKNSFKQYTIRNIPISIDQILRIKSKETGKSFNQVAIEALAAGVGQLALPKRDLGFIAGSISPKEAEQIEQEIKAQRKIDPRLWK